MAEVVGQEVLGEVDLHIRQGSDCAFVLEYAEEDATGAVVDQSFAGWVARSQVRKRVAGDVWLNMASDGDYLTLTAAAGVLTIAGLIPAAVTEEEAWNTRVSKVLDGEAQPAGVWDIELVSSTGAVIPFVEGAVFVHADVTRAL